MITLKDANNKWTCIKEKDFLEALATNKITIWGFSLECLLAFKEEYDIRAGKYPATPETVRRAFNLQRGET